MNIIDPNGLQEGERLAACSDTAQLHWPRLYLASNGYARLELSYASIRATVYRSFRNPPTEDQLWSFFEEYAANYLCILYEVEARFWAQFATSEKFLPRYKTARDNRTPAPPIELVEQHRDGYIAWKRSKSLTNQRFQKFSETPRKFQEVSDAVAVVGASVGVVADEEPGGNAREAPRAPDSPTPLSPAFRETAALVGEKLREFAPAEPDWDDDLEANIPDGLTLIQYRQFACEQLGVAKSYGNQVALQDGIEAIIEHEHETPASATRLVIQRGRDHPPEKGNWRFWVNDGGWKALASVGVSTEGLE